MGENGHPASVRAKLKNKAQSQGKEFNLVLTRFALERFLYRLSISEYRDQFVLKGALLFDLWFDFPLRATRDIDLLGFQTPDKTYLIKVFRTLCLMKLMDGIEFDQSTLQTDEIRKVANYSGLRVSLFSFLDGARSLVQVDVGFGDVITPEAELVDYPVLLNEFPSPQLRAYPRYSVIAEKLDALINLGMANSRMKDYFDLWVILKESKLEKEILKKAVNSTCKRRQTPMPVGLPTGLTKDFFKDKNKINQWDIFLIKNQLAHIELSHMVKDLQEKLSFLFLN